MVVTDVEEHLSPVSSHEVEPDQKKVGSRDWTKGKFKKRQKRKTRSVSFHEIREMGG